MLIVSFFLKAARWGQEKRKLVSKQEEIIAMTPGPEKYRMGPVTLLSSLNNADIFCLIRGKKNTFFCNMHIS